MTIAEQLGQIAQIKNDIRASINAKGVSLLQSAPFSEYATAIQSIEQTITVGGGTEFLNSYKRELLLEESNWVETDEGYFTMTVECEGVFEDENLQEIFVNPRSVYQRAYDLAGVGVIGQGENTLIFKADRLPEQNLLVQVGIVSAVEVNSEAVVLWSPMMHSDTSPSPYKVYPIDDDMYIAFDGDRETSIIFSTSKKYLTFDFGSLRMVYGIGVYAKAALIHTLRLLGSIDNENWNLIGEFSLVDLHSNSQKVIMFPSPVSYRYYKVDGSDVASGRNRLYELEFVVEGGNA